MMPMMPGNLNRPPVARGPVEQPPKTVTNPAPGGAIGPAPINQAPGGPVLGFNHPTPAYPNPISRPFSQIGAPAFRGGMRTPERL